MAQAHPLEEIVATALTYFDAGLKLTATSSPRDKSDPHPGKRPLGDGWQVRNWDRGELERAIRGVSGNVGVLCGRPNRLICVDVDAKHGGLRWYYENEHRFAAHLLEHTPGGGFHLYYRWPDGVEKLDTANKLAPGVEVKSDGTQVVTAPSADGDGRQYRIEHGLTLLDLDAEADELPRWIVDELLAIQARKASLGPAGSALGLINDPVEFERAQQALIRLGNKRTGEGRNNAAFHASLLGRDYGIAQNAWWPEVEKWNERNTPPLDYQKLRRVFVNAYRYAKAPVGSKTTAAQFPDDPEDGDDEPPALDAAAADEQEEALCGDEFPFKNPVRSARRFLGLFPDILFCEDTLYHYNKTRWRVLQRDALFSEIWRTIVGTDPLANLKSSHVTEIIKAIQAVKYCGELTFDQWIDARPGDYIRVENGILDLNKATLQPHSPDWFSLTQLPFAFDADADCPRFLAFLSSLWGGCDLEDQIEALQLWFGYLLSSKTNQQRFAMFLGKSRGGKGTLTKVMQSLLGEGNYADMTIPAFAGNFALQELPGKKLVAIADAHAGSLDATAAAAQFILNVVGEDVVAIDRKNRSILYCRLRSKIVVSANHMPKFFDSNGSITNRMILFRFTRTFQGKENRELETQLRAEMPGILNWALRGLEKLNGLGYLVRPSSSLQKLEELSETMNPLEAFIRQFVVVTPAEDAHALYVDEAYDLYKLWCAEGGHHPYAKGRFSAAVGDHFAGEPQVRKETTSWRQGRKRAFFVNLKLTCSPSEFRQGLTLNAFGELPDTDSDLDDDIPF